MLTRVDFPRPDSPAQCQWPLILYFAKQIASIESSRTNNHDIEVETLTDTLAVPLVGQVGETNVASKLATDDILHVVGSLGYSLGIPRADSLGINANVVALFDKRRFLASAGSRGRNGRTVGNRGRGS